ncbi:MAG: WG repeat-containing protein [Daejeonella sp.]
MNLKFNWANSFSEGLAAVLIDGKWGYINKQGQLIIEPQFTDASDFNNNIAIAGIENKRFCIDQSGKIISEEYRRISTFYEGLADVGLKGKTGYIDLSGKLVIPLKFLSAQNFSDGMGPVYIDSKQLGFINTKGEMVIDPIYHSTYGFNEGIAAITTKNGHGYINYLGEPITSFNLCSAERFSNGLAAACFKRDTGYHYINKEGEIAIEGPFNSCGKFGDNGLAIVQPMDKAGKAFGCIDRSGKMIIPAEFNNIAPFSDGLAMVERGEQSGFINEQGELVIGYNYFRKNTSGFTEGLARFSSLKKFGYYGFIDKNGEEVIEAKFNWTTFFSEGLAPVKINGKWGYINKSGEQVI